MADKTPRTNQTKMIDELIPNGTEIFFEYHCWESHESSDAQLWYRSHQKVTVIECVNAHENGDMSFIERCENGHQLVYKVQFPDGHIGDVFEDELMESEENYERPNPPQPLKQSQDTNALGYKTAKL